jgi:hypothetical protein
VKSQNSITKICKDCGKEFPNTKVYFYHYDYKQSTEKSKIKRYRLLSSRCLVNGCFYKHKQNNKEKLKGFKSKGRDEFEDFKFPDNYFENLKLEDLSLDEQKIFKNK